MGMLFSAEAQAVHFAALMPHLNFRTVAFKLAVVHAGRDLARTDPGHCLTIAALDRGLTKRITHRVCRVADRNGHRVALYVRIIRAFGGIALFDFCHLHNLTSFSYLYGLRFYSTVNTPDRGSTEKPADGLLKTFKQAYAAEDRVV
jgi:hypothetical protein